MSLIEQQLRMRLHIVKRSRDIERALHIRHFADLTETRAQLHSTMADLQRCRTESARLMAAIATIIKGLEEGLPPEDVWRAARTSIGLTAGRFPCR
ncbi:hypothetical protein CAL26_23825 [Bordetella genomosp. 9]|uniref:Uncharacterized protein n=1 Tax=Bordetella genomosp. 9 TaxID=1416803 RepID=A0A261R6W5_9BORD|nr:hypothetical protein [Bordetella genomosp. 9]OZI20527.1 hypothetical protein CAL26_23825 [Bordetella genomosp. 9]